MVWFFEWEVWKFELQWSWRRVLGGILDERNPQPTNPESRSCHIQPLLILVNLQNLPGSNMKPTSPLTLYFKKKPRTLEESQYLPWMKLPKRHLEVCEKAGKLTCMPLSHSVWDEPPRWVGCCASLPGPQPQDGTPLTWTVNECSKPHLEGNLTCDS